MNKKEIYTMIKEHSDDNLCLCTVLEGEHQGEHLLTKEQEILWKEADSDFLMNHMPLLQDGKGSAIVPIEDDRIFCEHIGGEEQLVVCGAGHVSMPIIRLGKMIGFPVTVIEDREEFADNARNAGADQVITADFEEALASIEDTMNTYYVIVTRGHIYDRNCLRKILSGKFAYVGMMGSRRRVGLVKEHLAEEGVAQELLDLVHTPIGLKIGAETPEEIAISIMAEIIEERRKDQKAEGYTKTFLTDLTDTSCTKVLATIISRKGSAPRQVGTKMIVHEDGSFVGTIGGGLLENEVYKYALHMMKENIAQDLITVDLSNKEAALEGMVCGGIVEVYLEKL